MVGRLSLRRVINMTKEEWLNLYFSKSDENREETMARFDAVPCDCNDWHCHGWKMELKPIPEEE